jgi:hypothetical protein
LVEQRTENPCVPGSIPGGTTTKGKAEIAFSFFFTKILKQQIYSFNFFHYLPHYKFQEVGN